MTEWLRRVWYLLNRSRVEAALREEMDAHRSMMSDPARFGNTLRLREESRDAWGWASLDALARDIRCAARGLRRTPMFTLTATASLALGLALTTATASVVNAYLLRSLPYAEVDRLYHVRYAPPGPWEPRGMTGLDWTSVKDAVEFPVASAGESFYFGEDGPTIPLRALRVTSGFVDGLGVSAFAGRPFGAADFVAGAEPVALIGHSLWRERFGSEARTIGRLLRVEAEGRPGTSETFRVVGVLPPGFYYSQQSRMGVDLLVPHAGPLRAYMVRLREGVPPAAAERRITDAARRAATAPIPAEWTGVQLESVHERWVAGVRPLLVGVTAAAALVLVIVCANVAVLILLRAMQRRKEMAVRLALGSGWHHVARMLLVETSIMCGAALAAGVAASALALRVLAPAIERQLGRQAPHAAGIVVDTTVLIMVGGICLVVVLALSLAPLTAAGRGLTSALQQDARSATAGRTMRRVRFALIGFEIAGSIVLLVGCGLMIRSVVTMTFTDLGFRPDGLATSRVMLRARNYPDAGAYRLFHERFARRASELARSPLVFSSWPPFVPPPVHVIERGESNRSVSAGVISVSAGYFDVLGVPMRQGRAFRSEEATADASVAVISETLAARLFPDGDALGKRVRSVEQTQGGSTPGPWRTVIGIAADVRQEYEDVDRADFYAPRVPDGRFGTFYVRTDRAAPVLFQDLQGAAAEIDRDAVINPPRPVADDNRQLAGTQFLTWLLTGFAGTAAFLAILGIYGVTAFAVQQRRKEIAIRVALGAPRAAVVGMFLRESGSLLGVGAVAGVAGAAVFTRLLQSQLFGARSFDVSTYALACGVLAAGGFAAAWRAARRAALSNPVDALNVG